MDQPNHSVGRNRGRHHHRKDDSSGFRRSGNDYYGEKEGGDRGGHGGGRRNRKPEQQFYIPKQQQEQFRGDFREEPSDLMGDGRKTPNLSNIRGDFPEEDLRGKHNPQRGGNFQRNHQHGQRLGGGSNSGNMNSAYNRGGKHQDNYGGQRQVRQASEPRIVPQTLPNYYHGAKERDTRSVEPNLAVREQPNKKPPSGRRNSGTGDKMPQASITRLPPNIESLPPRFQKKYLQENGLSLDLLNPPPPSSHPNPANEVVNDWDGRSIVFCGGNHHGQQNHGQNWSQTLPMPPRGARGRQRKDSDVTLDNTRSRSRSSEVSRGGKINDRLNHRAFERDDDYHRRWGGNEDNSGQRGNQRFQQRQSEEMRSPVRNRHGRMGAKGHGLQQNEERIVEEVKKPEPPLFPTTAILQMDWAAEMENVDNEKLQNSTVQQEQPKPHRRRGKNNSTSRNSGNSMHKDQENFSNQQQQQQQQPQQQPVFKVPAYPNRRNSKDSMPGSRETSQDRGFRQRSHYNRSRKNSYEYESVSREASLERLGGGGGRDGSRNRSRNRRRNRNSWSSRDNSAETHFMRNSQESLHSIRDPTNWRREINLDEEFKNISNQISTLNIDTEKGAASSKPGMIVLPQERAKAVPREIPRNSGVGPNSQQSKILFDPKNPHQPIVVTASQGRNYTPPDAINNATDNHAVLDACQYAGDKYYASNNANPPIWYDSTSEAYQQVHNCDLIDNLVQTDQQIQELLVNGVLFREWDTFTLNRRCLKQLLEQFLIRELKFCQQYNVEQHIWKLLYYNTIEMLRKLHAEDTTEDGRAFYKAKCLELIDEGSGFFEKLLKTLEQKYNFHVDNFVGVNAGSMARGLKMIGLALVSAQKLLLFMGDLARYREQILETSGYGKARQWYMKAQQILPSNGRPYNQLAVLSIYSKRKVDAVYYYMRSLMSSNPFKSARESLLALFDETRKKYENSQKKREEKNRLRLKEKEHRFGGALRRETWIHPEGGRRIHRTSPLDPAANRSGDTSEEEELENLEPIELNKRFITSYLHVHGKLITKIGMESFTQCAVQMLREFRALLRISPIPITSLRLLQLASLNMFAIDCTQLRDPSIAPGGRSEIQECAISIALIMFGIMLERFVTIIRETLSPESTPCTTSGSRQVFGPIITLDGENIVPTAAGKSNTTKNECGETWRATTTKESENSRNGKKLLVLNEDARVMLPSIKVWCDWLLCHHAVWNPPPTCSDYKLGSSTSHDPWSKLASLVVILENVDINRDILSTERKADYEIVRLQEDIALAGFTPLIYNAPEEIFCHRDDDIESAQNALRLQKILYVGTDYLCSCEPPVLKKVTYEDGTAEYISVVQNRTDESSDSEMLVESFSDEDENETHVVDNRVDSSEVRSSENICENDVMKKGSNVSSVASKLDSLSNCADNTTEIRKLLRRKDELERRHKMQEHQNQRLQDILRQSTVSVNIEVRPKFLIPDTNCFIDFLEQLQSIANAHPLYQLMVPLVVLNELEGLSRGLKGSAVTKSASNIQSGNNLLTVNTPLAPTLTIFPSTSVSVSSKSDPKHVAMVAEASKNALMFLKSKNPAVKCVTTKGSILNSSVFTVEDDNSEPLSNDDKILATAVHLCKNNVEEDRDGTRYIAREVVLLTTDRNLRVKSLSRDVPVRELPDFIKWAGLGP
ncbi:telomerase-binding protein EST1A isoform X2 [Phlebotomus papatasi]|uniref:telomerase-binding protein EST1A isoform X2 n=1 Tax=Phlebotomus papatasi TaxID=29031 RepID=UPI0024838208|nr:telomerase-binding protein EST1A isoform X2 [Phlebotomus papatasi]